MGNPTVRANVATVCFTLAGVFAYGFRASDIPNSLPHIIFYATLIINTYFSIGFFASRFRQTISQTVTDYFLFVLYLALALSVGHSLLFPLIAAAIFCAACVKYLLLLECGLL